MPQTKISPHGPREKVSRYELFMLHVHIIKEYTTNMMYYDTRNISIKVRAIRIYSANLQYMHIYCKKQTGLTCIIYFFHRLHKNKAMPWDSLFYHEKHLH